MIATPPPSRPAPLPLHSGLACDHIPPDLCAPLPIKSDTDGRAPGGARATNERGHDDDAHERASFSRRLPVKRLLHAPPEGAATPSVYTLYRPCRQRRLPLIISSAI